MFARLAALSFLLAALGTSGCTSSNACTPGRLETCPCVGGGTGIQECLGSGTFGSCMCETTDASVADGGVLDTPAGEDAPLDAGGPEDTSSAPDAPADVRGHAVVIGMYSYTADEAFDRMTANAVLLSERPGDIAVTEYMEHAGVPGSAIRARLQGVIDERADAAGRTVTYTDLTSAFDLAGVIATTDVLLVHGQTYAPAGWMSTIAMAWHDALVAFIDAGGVVVVLAAQHQEHLVLSGEDLFGLPSLTQPFVTPGTTFTIVTPTDPLVADILSPFVATESTGVGCFAGSTGGMIVARETVALCPVVRHLER